jgi:hypothetical protein
MINWSKLPPRFTQDSIERGIFKPATDTHATVSQLLVLLSDAEFYADKHGPDQCSPGLIVSARATVKALKVWFH